MSLSLTLIPEGAGLGGRSSMHHSHGSIGGAAYLDTDGDANNGCAAGGSNGGLRVAI